MIHNSNQLAQDFPYLGGRDVNNVVQSPSEKAVTRFVAAVKVAFVDGVWVVYNPLFYPNYPEKIPMNDSWHAGVSCGHYDPDFVVRGFKIEAAPATEDGGETRRQICYDLRFPTGERLEGDSRPRFLIDNYADEIVHPGEITRLWLDDPREATTVNSITLYK